ncbi:hypothetical protein ACTXG7_15205 [Mycolicibacterium sp. Dal123E01]|uniref:hypothetical protein n=1 Tax=Mycolicibacterium sp. Dal123E01 TaxID=3457578 RepID=UPI00403E65DA
MQSALNRTLTTGVVLVGASALALTPIVASGPDIQLPSIRSAEVQMAAFVNPIDEWIQVIGTSFTNLSALGNQVALDPTPILSQLTTNFFATATTLVNTASQTFGQAVSTFAAMPQALLTAAQQVAEGHVADAVQTIWGSVLLPPAFLAIIPISAVIPLVQNAAQNVANVIGALGGTNLLLTGIAVISPIYATITQFGDSAQAVVDAVKAGDFATAASALINAPAMLTNAFLNGNDMTPGLLTPLDGVGGGGAIAALLKLRDAVAVAIAPPAAPESAAAKTLKAKIAAPTEATASESSDGATTLDASAGTVKAHGAAAASSKTKADSGKKATGAATSHGETSSGKAGSGRHHGAA